MLLINGVIPKTIETGNNVQGVHFKYLDVSRKLRLKIKELDEFKIKVDRELKNARSYKNYVNGLEQRNYRLNEEVKRFLRIANARLRKIYPNKMQRRAWAANMWRRYVERQNIEKDL